MKNYNYRFWKVEIWESGNLVRPRKRIASVYPCASSRKEALSRGLNMYQREHGYSFDVWACAAWPKKGEVSQ